jgi:NAD(P)-dependent dehydrogenase (short-subunit alcohol dehydrogenase family)
MSGRLDGQVAVVTGGGKGLGRAFALHLAGLGAAVVVNNRNREVDAQGLGPADHVVAEILAAGGRAVAEHSDVRSPGAADAIVRTALEHFGRLDVLVTSAAVSLPQMFHKTTEENFRQVLDINVVGTVLVAAAASAVMRAAGHGRIVLVASTAGLHGEPTVSAYAASKGAVIALGRTMAVEGAPKSVFTNVLLPYATTQMTEQGMDPRHAARMESELVAPVVGALADPDSTLNGEVIVAAGAGLRATDTEERGTVLLPPDAADLAGSGLSGAGLAELLERSRRGPRHRFAHAQEAFQSLASDLAAELVPTPAQEH